MILSLDLSPDTQKVLKDNGIDTLLKLVALYPTGYLRLRGGNAVTMSDIHGALEKCALRNNAPA